MSLTPEQTRRRARMALLAKAAPARLAALLPALPPYHLLRAPEIGSVMVRGRIGGTGAPFNLGETTVTRATVRMADGTVGHAMVQGRDRDHATRAALADAMAETDPEQIEAAVLAPLRAEAEARRQARAARAAATRVEFFTLVRGEDT